MRIGNPKRPQLTSVLALNELSNGAQGTVALEDVDRFQIAGHVVTNPRALILPMQDRRTGLPATYNLEPFLPMLAVSNKGWLNPPKVPFRFPSGSLTVTVRKPNGSTRNLGSAPFSQDFVQSISDNNGSGKLAAASNIPRAYYKLTTLDPRFNTTFDQFGRHEIQLSGHIDDIKGTRYAISGTYEIFVARTLDLETGVFPGTPFEVGNVFSPTVIVQPPVPADVEVSVRLLPESDPARAIERVVRGRANRFGFFQPNLAEPIGMSAAGEYRVDYTVSFRDEEGVLWMGSAAWGSVVETPGSPLIVHGRRGFGGSDQQAWLKVREISNTGSGHLIFPFHSGDVMWMEDLLVDSTFTANVPGVSIQDSEGSFADRVRSRANFFLEPGDEGLEKIEDRRSNRLRRDPTVLIWR